MAKSADSRRSSAQEGARRPGRPVKPQDGSKSALAALSAQLRELRLERALTLQNLAELTDYSWQHLGAIERGQVVPSENVIAACDASLLANGKLITMLAAVVREQAHVRHQNAAARRPTRRLSAAQAGAEQTPGYAPDLDWERLADVSRRPSRITTAIVEDLELITDRQRRLYHHLSSAEMLACVHGHLGVLTTFLGYHQSAGLRHRIAAAAAEAAGFAAWLWFDLGDAFQADQSYRHAHAAVAEATDRGLSAYIKGYQGIVSAQRTGPDAALVHLDEACATAPRSLSKITRAWLAVLTAEALAHTGQRTAALAAINRSRALLDSAPVGESDPWMFDFNSGRLAAHTGYSYLALNQPERAVDAFEEALRLLPPSCDRRAATITVGLAHARLASGELEEAQRMAAAALVVFAERGSVAGLHQVRGIRNAFRAAGHHAAASALDEQARAGWGAVSG
ncbi:MAG: helix-turn-helix transcriptional regulator [Pseudonocardiales bacterium]|nr:helix-turn-helix transcriptional regulator [Pseudonocardiales bacterium]